MGVDLSRATQSYDDGSYFRGQCKEGRFHGKGMFKFGECLGPQDRPNQFKHKGCKHAEGKYDGMFEDGCMHGQGVYYYPCGGRYQGQFRMSLRDGYGVYTWPDGSLYEGSWVQDQPEGDGRVIHTTGEIVTTTFSAGIQDFDEDRWREQKEVDKIAQSIDDEAGRNPNGVAGAIANYAHLRGAAKALSDHAAAKPADKKYLEPGANQAQQAIGDMANQILFAGGKPPPPRPPLPPPVNPVNGAGGTLPAGPSRPSLTGFGEPRHLLSAPGLPALPPLPPTGNRHVMPPGMGTGTALLYGAGGGGDADVTQLPMLPPMAPLARPPPAPPVGGGAPIQDGPRPPMPPPGQYDGWPASLLG